MKIFWAILIALVLAAGAYLALKSDKGKDIVNAPPALEITPPMNRGVQNDEGAFFEGDPTPTTPPPASAAASSVPPSAPTSTPQGPSVKPAETPATTPTPDNAAKPNQGLTKEQMAEAAAKARRDAAAKDAKPATTPDAPTPNAPSTKPDVAAAATIIEGAPADVKITKRDDGTVLIDDKYTLRGEGTADHPYEITWDFLTSAEETYQPRLGKKTVPARLTMLNDKYVKISGYVAFPIMATEPTEMLSMLNQWDGCCIGVPPTPYDAIEVKLKSPAEGEDRLASFGAVKGKFRVDPYLVKDWLVSLYMMDEGEVSRK